MNNGFQIEWHQSNGDLHVRPEGEFDGATASELLSFLRRNDTGLGEVLIDTDRLVKVHPFGCSVFKYRLEWAGIAPERMVFRGAMASDIAPEGSRVMLPEPAHHQDGCKCKGQCVECKCKQKAA